MIRNVALFYPAARRYSGFLSTHRLPGLVIPHAGLTILAQVLDRQGVRARVYDEQIAPFQDSLIDGADLAGISLGTAWAPQAYRLAARIRARGVPVVLGGAHATLNPDEAAGHADYVVRGEGEETLPELLRALDDGRTLDGIAGLSFRRNGRVWHNPPRPPMDEASLDRVPWPRLDLVEGLADPIRFPLNRLIYFTMLTRGCDQACNYCSITRLFGRALRHRSVAGVMAELRARFDPERQFLFFTDDSLAADRDFLKEFLAALLDERMVPRLGWHSQMRADAAEDPELLGLMEATNCAFVTCGFESISDRSLETLGKGQTSADVARAIALFSKHGIVVNGFFMFGTDDDGPESVAKTVRFARDAGCAFAGFMPLTPFPGTPVFDRLEKDGRIFTRDWELYDVQHVVFHPRRMSAWDLYRRTMWAYPAFYAGRSPLSHAAIIRSRRRPAASMAVGFSWPWLKTFAWGREVAANLDYARALRRLNPGTELPDVSGRLWAKDLLSGRSLRGLRSRRAGAAALQERRIVGGDA